MTGEVRDVIPIGPRVILSIVLDATAEKVGKYIGQRVNVEIGPIRKGRTLSQNAYYWQLLTKVAEKLHTSTAFQHNRLLRQHPRFDTIAGEIPTLLLKEREGIDEEIMEDEHNHLYPTTQLLTNSAGTVFRYYRLMRGSKTFNTAEMSVLLDDLIADAQEAGIETLTPAELERIREWERQRETKAQEQSAS